MRGPGMEKQWFVLHTMTGKETRIRDSILYQAKFKELEDCIGEVSVPCEKVTEVKKGKRSTITQKFFPGYVLISMSLYDDGKLNEPLWYFIREIPGVLGFLGGDRPTALQPDEVAHIQGQIAEKQDKTKPKVTFEPGETVKINDGPFMNFNGVIEELDPERGKLKVSVSIFGRTAPVELEYWQVERV